MGFQIAINIGFAMAFVASFYILSYIKVGFGLCLSNIHPDNTRFFFY